MSYLIPDSCFLQGNPVHHFLFSSLLMCSTYLLSKEKPNDIVDTVILVFLGFKKSEWQSKFQMALNINYHYENSQLKNQLFKISCVDIKRENIVIFFLLSLSSIFGTGLILLLLLLNLFYSYILLKTVWFVQNHHPSTDFSIIFLKPCQSSLFVKISKFIVQFLNSIAIVLLNFTIVCSKSQVIP